MLVASVFALLWSISSASNSPEGARILVFGDSLSAAYGFPREEGWVALMVQRLNERPITWEVHNPSISGETTAGGRNRLDAQLAQWEPDLVILGLGGNDGLRGLSLRALRENLEAMIMASLARNAQVILLGMDIPPNYGPAYTERFRAIYRDLAANHALDLLPFRMDQFAADAALLLDDGIHPSAAAQPLILEQIWPRVLPLLESIEARYQARYRSEAVSLRQARMKCLLGCG